MSPIKKLLLSTLGKKYLMSLTGLALVGFLVAHLLGNLQLLLPSGEYFNRYAHHLEALGPLLWASEIGLLAIAGVHVLVAISINLGTLKARPVRYYAGEQTKGGESKSNLSSRHMLILGTGVLAFIIFHVFQFKFGAYYATTIDGFERRDLHKLVKETFEQPWWVLLYSGGLGFLTFHLRHGIWSAFQSLGAMPGKISKGAYAVGVALAVLLGLGFVMLPVWIYLGIPEHIANLLGAK